MVFLIVYSPSLPATYACQSDGGPLTRSLPAMDTELIVADNQPIVTCACQSGGGPLTKLLPTTKSELVVADNQPIVTYYTTSAQIPQIFAVSTEPPPHTLALSRVKTSFGLKFISMGPNLVRNHECGPWEHSIQGGGLSGLEFRFCKY